MFEVFEMHRTAIRRISLVAPTKKLATFKANIFMKFPTPISFKTSIRKRKLSYLIYLWGIISLFANAPIPWKNPTHQSELNLENIFSLVRKDIFYSSIRIRNDKKKQWKKCYLFSGPNQIESFILIFLNLTARRVGIDLHVDNLWFVERTNIHKPTHDLWIAWIRFVTATV